MEFRVSYSVAFSFSFFFFVVVPNGERCGFFPSLRRIAYGDGIPRQTAAVFGGVSSFSLFKDFQGKSPGDFKFAGSSSASCAWMCELGGRQWN